MGIEKFQIFLDVFPPVFYAGQNISGRLVVSNSTTKTFRGVYIKAKGEAFVHWKSSRMHSVGKMVNIKGKDYCATSSHNDEDAQLYTAREIYFDQKWPILEGGIKQTLEPGERIFHFNFILPTNDLPSSFESPCGYVRYPIKAVMDRPWKFNHEAKVFFTIISPLDLNSYPQSAAPVRVEKTKKFCCLCCVSGPVNVALSLHAGGGAAVPGDTLLANLDVENNSNVNLLSVSLKLIKLMMYKAREGRCTMSVAVTIVKKSLGQVGSGQSCSFENQAIQIPALPPSNLINCKIIDLDYFLEAHITPSGAHRDFNVRIPVLVGTIPLVQNFAKYAHPSPQSLPSSQELTPSAPQCLIDAHPSYADLAPPSYVESVFGARNVFDAPDDKYVFGDKHFAPMYPVFYRS